MPKKVKGPQDEEEQQQQPAAKKAKKQEIPIVTAKDPVTRQEVPSHGRIAKIISYNVNGLNSFVNNGTPLQALKKLVEQEAPDVLLVRM